jgi:membrane protein DedA with SNARE-associated domain
VLKYALMFWIARWLGREIAARLESRHQVLE